MCVSVCLGVGSGSWGVWNANHFQLSLCSTVLCLAHTHTHTHIHKNTHTNTQRQLKNCQQGSWSCFGISFFPLFLVFIHKLYSWASNSMKGFLILSGLKYISLSCEDITLTRHVMLLSFCLSLRWLKKLICLKLIPLFIRRTFLWIKATAQLLKCHCNVIQTHAYPLSVFNECYYMSDSIFKLVNPSSLLAGVTWSCLAGGTVWRSYFLLSV